MKTLRIKIVMITIICSLVMGISLGILSYIYSSDMAVEDSKEYMLSKAEEKKTEFEMTLGELTDEEREIILKGCLINYNRV